MRKTLSLLASVFLASAATAGGAAQPFSVDLQALAEIWPLALEAVQIQRNASAREAKHAAELARRGVAEEPAEDADRYALDAGALGKFLFDNWGEFHIDRRFVTTNEMAVVRKIEAWCRKYFPSPVARKPRAESGRVAGVPVFRGFEDDRYQMHDALIAQVVKEFNANKAGWCGGTAAQASKIPNLTPALVKSHMIEESGGRAARSRAAWAKDPLQVNVPGDWGDEKELVGLVKPTARNEGRVEDNVRAAVKYLSRKGFSVAAKPAAERENGFFDGWADALRRYNGRRDRTDTDRYYSEEYSDRILKRAADPEAFVPIEIRLAAKAPAAKEES